MEPCIVHQAQWSRLKILFLFPQNKSLKKRKMSTRQAVSEALWSLVTRNAGQARCMHDQGRGWGLWRLRSGPQGHCYGFRVEVTRSFGSTGHCLIKLATLPIPPPAALL